MEETLQTYLVPGLLVLFFGGRYLRFRLTRARLPKLLEQGAKVVDVRTAGEFALQSWEGAVNIPLDALERNLDSLDKSKPVIVCCASGMRSGVAASVLKRHGFASVVNAGPWTNARDALIIRG